MGEKVIRVVTDVQNNLLNKTGLEFEKYFGETGTKRYYDIAYEYGNNLFKFIEVKSWKNFNATTFKTQFKKDLQNIESFDQLEWIFDSKLTFNLKDEVIDALKNDRDGFKSVLSMEKVIKLFEGKNADLSIIDKDNFVDVLIQNLEKDEIFNSILKVQ